MIFGLAVRAPLLPRPGYLGDQKQYFVWAYLAAQFGPASVYEPYEEGDAARRWCNYPPVMVYVLQLVAAGMPIFTGRPYDIVVVRAMSIGEEGPGRSSGIGSRHGGDPGQVLFKLPATLADLATGLLLFTWLRRRTAETTAGLVALAYMLNPVVIHNSAVWGQVDSLYTLFLLLSVQSAATGRLKAMSGWAALAVLTKPQAALIVPLCAAAWIVSCRGKPWKGNVRSLLACLAVAVVVAAVMVLPLGTSAWNTVYEVYGRAVGYYPYRHLNGFSLWFLTNPLHAPAGGFSGYLRDDVSIWLGQTPRVLGLVAFATVSLFVVMMIVRSMGDAASFRLAARVLPLAFFVLPTQIHERYLFPTVALWAWAFAPTWKWRAGWFAISALALVNVIWVFQGRDWLTRLQAPLQSAWWGPSVGVWVSLGLLLLLGATWAETIQSIRRRRS